jgi:hypothetical protein
MRRFNGLFWARATSLAMKIKSSSTIVPIFLFKADHLLFEISIDGKPCGCQEIRMSVLKSYTQAGHLRGRRFSDVGEKEGFEFQLKVEKPSGLL